MQARCFKASLTQQPLMVKRKKNEVHLAILYIRRRTKTHRKKKRAAKFTWLALDSNNICISKDAVDLPIGCTLKLIQSLVFQKKNIAYTSNRLAHARQVKETSFCLLSLPLLLLSLSLSLPDLNQKEVSICWCRWMKGWILKRGRNVGMTRWEGWYKICTVTTATRKQPMVKCDILLPACNNFKCKCDCLFFNQMRYYALDCNNKRKIQSSNPDITRSASNTCFLWFDFIFFFDCTRVY